MSLNLGIRRPRPKHRAIDAVENLREENQHLRAQLVGAATAIGHLDQRLAEVTGELLATRGTNVNLVRQVNDLAIERNKLVRDNEALAQQLAPYLAADANRNAVTVPPSIRDTTAGEDQATTPIDVRPLWQAFGISPIVRVDNPQATDPTHVPVTA